MRQRAIRSRIHFTFPSDEETDQVFQPSIDAFKMKLIVDVPTSNFTVDDPPRNEYVVVGEVPDTTFASYKPPLKNDVAKDVPVSTPISDDPKLDDEEDHFKEIMFEEDNKTVGVIPIPSTFNMLQKPSSSKAHFDFGLSSSSDEMEGKDDQDGNNNTSPCLETKIDGDQEDPV